MVATSASDAVLEVAGIEVSYGVIPAVRGLTFEVKKGEIFVILGANGAGKTTTLGTISGLLRPKRGTVTVYWDGIRSLISGQPAHTVARLGVALVPEGRGILTRMTVLENLEVGGLFVRKDRSNISSDIDALMDRFPVLKERARQSAGNLSGGEQQMLAIARGLMMNPRLLLLDEPSLGLAPKTTAQIFEIIQQIRDQEGVTIVLVEQNAKKSLQIADRACVLETGLMVLIGSAEELRNNDVVVKAYLS